MFHKVDIEQIDLSKVPQYPKSRQELKDIIPLLKKNFLTKNLNDGNILQLANAMKYETFKNDDVIIKYGDIGSTYYLLDKGCVKVLLYREGANPDDEDL